MFDSLRLYTKAKSDYALVLTCLTIIVVVLPTNSSAESEYYKSTDQQYSAQQNK